MFDKKKPKRFIVKEEQSLGMTGALQIIVDTQTGVNYLNTIGMSVNGLTPLIGSDGKIIIDPVGDYDGK